ncbi:hypothetical protein Tco_0206697 [Tanacetum coccineum]
MTSGLHIAVGKKAFGYETNDRDIEKNGRDIEKNDQDIEKNGRGIEKNGRGIEKNDRRGDFILKEIETFLHTPEELSNINDDYYDTEGDILYLEKLLNKGPSLTLPPMKNNDVKQVDVTLTKPSIEEPPELELKDLPSHLEYAFLEGTNKLPVIISK